MLIWSKLGVTVPFTHSDLELELEQQYQECKGVNVRLCDLKKTLQ